MKPLLLLVLLLAVPARALDIREVVAQRILLLSHQARQEAGLRPLVLDRRLSQAALQHSQEMDRLGYFGHHSPVADFATLARRMLAVGFYGLTSAENLHREQGYSALRGGDHAVQAWLTSPQHRRNLLNPKYNRMGLGISMVGEQCTITQDLAYSAIEVVEQQVQPRGNGYHLTLHCQVSDGPHQGAVIYQGRRCADWIADAQGEFQVEVDLPGPGTVGLGQAVGERDWVIETEWQGLMPAPYGKPAGATGNGGP